ncbi:MAG: hypothetical protein IJY39_08930 [Clostridia bacterium]|nr:hypothetical protein [Clostridia bacterium]
MANERKEKRRVNVFDVVILLLLLCLVASFVYRIYMGIDKDKASVNDAYYVMSFECDREYDSLLRYLESGDAVYFAADGKLLGYLYAGEDSENGAIYEIIDDIPTFAGDQIGTEAQEESETEAGVGEYDNSLYQPSALPEQTYKYVRIGGQIGLNSETVKVKNGSYYFIGETNFTVGSVIEVYTDDAVFTIKVVNIEIIE